MALGAESGSVQRLIIRQGLQLTAIAFVIGLPAALLVSKLFASILYGIQPHDLLTFISIPLFLAAVATFAAYLPARRASRVDPTVALRYE